MALSDATLKIYFTICGKVAEIQELFVDEGYRNEGIGRLLISYLEQRLPLAHCLSFEVTAQNKRLQTHAFYEQSGFVNTNKKFVKPCHDLLINLS